MPRPATCNGLYFKCSSVFSDASAWIQTSPPRPPSPPDGPPRGTNFSRRKARQPLPPSPAFTRIVASSINKLCARAKQTVPFVSIEEHLSGTRGRQLTSSRAKSTNLVLEREATLL